MFFCLFYSVLDLEATAKRVIHDCAHGKIQLYVSPPTDLPDSATAQVLEEFDDAFEFADDGKDDDDDDDIKRGF